MGCSALCKSELPVNIDHEIYNAIVVDNFIKFKALVRSFYSSSKGKKFDINAYTIIGIANKSLTIPALTVIYGRLNFFRFLHLFYKIDFIQLENHLSSHKLSTLFILCSKNYSAFLSYFLPFYMVSCENKSSLSSYALRLDGQMGNEETTAYTPIQIACDLGYLNIIRIASDFFQTGKFVPNELDVNYANPLTGENCALIACRHNNYVMVRFLHTVCNADFQKKNFKNENALQIACLGFMNPGDSTVLMRLFKYLVEEAQVDATYKYQETLKMCKEPEALEYLTNILATHDIFISKADEYTFESMPSS